MVMVRVIRVSEGITVEGGEERGLRWWWSW
jgi:hypothetical protein